MTCEILHKVTFHKNSEDKADQTKAFVFSQLTILYTIFITAFQAITSNTLCSIVYLLTVFQHLLICFYTQSGQGGCPCYWPTTMTQVGHLSINCCLLTFMGTHMTEVNEI